MNVYDFAILAIIILFGLNGLKEGVLKTVVRFIGLILVVVFSYMLKNAIGDFLVLNLPFFNFKGFFGGTVIYNILLYQGIAFILLFVILMLVYRVLLIICGIFEKVFAITIVLSIPSKILGFIVGLIEGYIIAYVLLFFLSQPYINIGLNEKSNWSNSILESTPLISNYTNKALNIFYEIKDVYDESSKEKIEDTNDIDYKMAEIVLKEKVISSDTMMSLVDKGKVKIQGIEELIYKYKE